MYVDLHLKLGVRPLLQLLQRKHGSLEIIPDWRTKCFGSP
jgi:hypothetical protein